MVLRRAIRRGEGDPGQGGVLEGRAGHALIERQLRASADPQRAAGSKAYLKSDLAFIGVRVPEVRRVVRGALRPSPGREDLLRLAAALWAQPVHEFRLAAVQALTFRVADLEPEDLAVVERMLREARTWALVDPLAIDVAGPMVVAHPELGATLDRWAHDDDFWLRRAAMLALLRPLRSGGGDWERFTRYADAMLDEREFFIRKAIGWVLRDTGRRRPELVAAWIGPRRDRASGVTLREVEKVVSD